MKQLLTIGIFGFALCSYCNAQTDSTEILLNKLISRTITDPERKELRRIGFDLQNRGQILDESKHDYAGSLVLTDKAIKVFNLLRDTLNEANNRKFKGYLLGRFGRFDEGKAEIQQAINLFQSKNAGWGIAVSQFDLSRLYEFENKLDSAIYYCSIAIDYWKAKGNPGRVFLNQNMLINLLTRSNELSKARSLQTESTKMAADPEHHWQGLLDFYVVSANLYKAAKQAEPAKHYQKLFMEKLLELKKGGIEAMSYFAESK